MELLQVSGQQPLREIATSRSCNQQRQSKYKEKTKKNRNKDNANTNKGSSHSERLSQAGPVISHLLRKTKQRKGRDNAKTKKRQSRTETKTQQRQTKDKKTKQRQRKDCIVFSSLLCSTAGPTHNSSTPKFSHQSKFPLKLSFALATNCGHNAILLREKKSSVITSQTKSKIQIHRHFIIYYNIQQVLYFN